MSASVIPVAYFNAAYGDSLLAGQYEVEGVSGALGKGDALVKRIGKILVVHLNGSELRALAYRLPRNDQRLESGHHAAGR